MKIESEDTATFELLRKEFEGITDAKRKKAILDELRFLIQRRIEGIHYAETRRTGFLTIAIAMFAGGVALATASIANYKSSPHLFFTLIVFAFALLLGSGYLWRTYVFQTNYPYPFLRVYEDKKWFYHGALPESSEYAKLENALRPAWPNKEELSNLKAVFKRGIGTFESNTKQWLLSEGESLIQDVQQLHVLHANECIKNKFLTQSKKVLTFWLVFAAVLTILGAVAFPFLGLSPKTPDVSYVLVTLGPSKISSESGASISLCSVTLSFQKEVESIEPSAVVLLDVHGMPIHHRPVGTVRLISIGGDDKAFAYLVTWMNQADIGRVSGVTMSHQGNG